MSDEPRRCFMDGIAWEHELGSDADGTLLFPSEKALRASPRHQCVNTGGCGVVLVEVRLIRWVEPQDLVIRGHAGEVA